MGHSARGGLIARGAQIVKRGENRGTGGRREKGNRKRGGRGGDRRATGKGGECRETGRFLFPSFPVLCVFPLFPSFASSRPLRDSRPFPSFACSRCSRCSRSRLSAHFHVLAHVRNDGVRLARASVVARVGGGAAVGFAFGLEIALKHVAPIADIIRVNSFSAYRKTLSVG